MKRYNMRDVTPYVTVHPDGEWIRYTDHVEAMKRIAGDTIPPITAGFIRAYDEVNGPIPAAPSASAQQAEPVDGDVLPAIGTDLLIHLASQDEWVSHKVIGYYVWPDLKGNPFLQRVFVRVRDSQGYPNARMLRDARRLDGTPFVVDNRTAAPAPGASPAALTDEREAFETWVSDSGRAHLLARDESHGWYADLTVTAWWAAWQARALLAASPADQVEDARDAAGWQTITAPGQVSVGDKLLFLIGADEYIERVKEVLFPGTDKEEIIYNKRRNYYLITSMAMENKGSQKHVRFKRAAMSATPPAAE